MAFLFAQTHYSVLTTRPHYFVLTTLSSLLITMDKKKIIKAIIMALIAARDAEVLWQNCLRKEIMWRKDYTAQARHRV